MKYNTPKFFFTLLFCSLTFFACHDNQTDADYPDDRQQMLSAMEITAQIVSQVSVSEDVKRELLSYSLDKFAGEVTAHFSELLPNGNIPRGKVSNNELHGSFATAFRPKVEELEPEASLIRTETNGGLQSDLEAYLLDHQMALYAPYFAENHANSTKPITVSFDPLDDSKLSNVGYMFVPKVVSQGSSANLGDSDVSMNFDNYELVQVSNVDDDYAWQNPTIFVIPDDGNAHVPNGVNNGGNTPHPNRDVDCEALEDSDIVQLYMRRFKLNGNFRSAPWLRNFLEMWVITGDDISFDSNNTAVVNENTAKLWRRKQVSRRDGRKKNWLDSGIGALDLNWQENEDNAYMIIAYKSGNNGGAVTANVKTVLNSDGTTQTTTTINATIPLLDKYESFHQFPYDRCGTLAVFRTDQGLGLHENLSVFGADKIQFTMEAVIR